MTTELEYLEAIYEVVALGVTFIMFGFGWRLYQVLCRGMFRLDK